MSDEKKTAYICFVIRVGGRIKEINVYPTEEQADAFAIEETGYSELHPELDPPDFWDKYDPPTVLVFEAENTDALENGKYTRPVAVFQQGVKWRCVKDEDE